MVTFTLQGVEDILGSLPNIIFILSFVNIGCHVFSHQGLACTFGRHVLLRNSHFPTVIFSYPEQGFAIEAILLLLCLQNTPYRLHELSLREASETASQREKNISPLSMSFSVPGPPWWEACCLGSTYIIFGGDLTLFYCTIHQRFGIRIWLYGAGGVYSFGGSTKSLVEFVLRVGIQRSGSWVDGRSSQALAQRSAASKRIIYWPDGRGWDSDSEVLLGCI